MEIIIFPSPGEIFHSLLFMREILSPYHYTFQWSVRDKVTFITEMVIGVTELTLITEILIQNLNFIPQFPIFFLSSQVKKKV
jgi:hypothetical protein